MIVAVGSAMYPYGTSEQYPSTFDVDGNIQSNTAHEYAECSNKGYCNRRLGQCICLPGYSGSACQYLSCPIGGEGDAVCSGHGICELAESIAAADSGNVYELWDRQSSMGCVCDSGYFGPACEFRYCKSGYDPIFFDDDSSYRYSNWSYVIYTKTENAIIAGNYSLILFDQYGEDWATEAIAYDATCADIVSSIERLPNRVFHPGTVRCLVWLDYSDMPPHDESIQFASDNIHYGKKITLAFPANPGVVRQPELNIFLDGARPSLYSNEASSTLGFFVYPDGFVGENYEYFTDKCVGVDVSILQFTDISNDVSYNYISDLIPLEERLLQQCLGDADALAQTNSASGRVLGHDYTWDYGSLSNPHIVRLVEKTVDPVTDLCPGAMNSIRGEGVTCDYQYQTRDSDENTDSVFVEPSVFGSNGHIDIVNKQGAASSRVFRPPGFFAALYFDYMKQRFVLLTQPVHSYSPATLFSVFTTTGTAQMVSDYAKIVTSSVRPYSKVIYSTRTGSNATAATYGGNIDCETNQPNTNGALDCLEKGDRVFFLDPRSNTRSSQTNPKYLNIYTVEKISKEPYLEGSSSIFATNTSGTNQIALDMSINSAWSWTAQDEARAYVFRPPRSVWLEGTTSGPLKYVAECSNRGNCDSFSGICECFTGFSGDDCSFHNNVVS